VVDRLQVAALCFVAKNASAASTVATYESETEVTI
jgi:hypothetical protein